MQSPGTKERARERDIQTERHIKEREGKGQRERERDRHAEGDTETERDSERPRHLGARGERDRLGFCIFQKWIGPAVRNPAATKEGTYGQDNYFFGPKWAAIPFVALNPDLARYTTCSDDSPSTQRHSCVALRPEPNPQSQAVVRRAVAAAAPGEEGPASVFE